MIISLALFFFFNPKWKNSNLAEQLRWWSVYISAVLLSCWNGVNDWGHTLLCSCAELALPVSAAFSASASGAGPGHGQIPREAVRARTVLPLFSPTPELVTELCFLPQPIQGW